MFLFSLPNSIRYLILLLAVTLLAACSGGETGTGITPQPDPNPEPANDTVIGPISSFGSVIVNGVQFDTRNSTVTLDGEPADESDLSIGMLVEVKGTVNSDNLSGSAQSIDGQFTVKGLISQPYNRINASMVVLGQTVKVDDATEWTSDDTTITELNQVSVNSYVEVSGYSQGDGIIYATLINHKMNPLKISIKGIVKNLTGNQFEIGGQLILIEPDTEFLNILQEDLKDGLYVKVESSDLNHVSGLSAISIKKEKENEVTAGALFKLEGIVNDTTIASNNRFKLVGHTVEIDDTSTIFENGSKELINVGSKLLVSGSGMNDGAILADKIKFVLPSELKIRSELLNDSDVDTNTGRISLINRIIDTNLFTVFKDDSREGELETDNGNSAPLNLSDIKAGDVLDVRLFRDTLNGNFIATKLTLKEFEAEHAGETELEGVVEANMDTRNKTFSILGVTIDFSQANKNVTPKDIGKRVEIKGTYNFQDDILVATSIEFEN